MAVDAALAAGRAGRQHGIAACAPCTFPSCLPAPPIRPPNPCPHLQLGIRTVPVFHLYRKGELQHAEQGAELRHANLLRPTPESVVGNAR